MPFGIVACAVFLVGAFFLRSSSIPTGLNSQHLFFACCASLIGTFVYIWFSRDLHINIVALVAVLLMLPSLRMAEDTGAAAFRWFGWLMVVAVVGPLFLNEIRLKLQVLDWTRKLLVVCAVGSLLLNFAGIRLSGRGMFFGLMGHTMILAPVCALAAIDLFCTLKKERSTWHIVLLAICCMTCVGTGSRGAVIGLAFAIMTHVAHRREGILVLALAGAGLVGVSYVQASQTAGVVGQDLSGGLYSELANKGTNDTRGELWGYRISEFKSSPVFGVGFQQQRLYRDDSNQAFIEPGSSYLAVLSMTGIVGAIGFVALMGTLISSLFGRNSAIPDRYKDLLRGWTAFFAVHFVIEGYIFACGSLLCFLFWLTAGCSVSLHHMGRQKQRQDRLADRARRQQMRVAA